MAVFRFVAGFECISAVLQYLGLDLQEIGLNGSRAADAPQQGRKPEHELALDGCSGIVVRDDGCFECLVVFNVFERGNDGLRRQSMSDCVLPRPPFAVFGFRTGAAQRIASIGLDLSKRSHPRVSLSGFSETEPPASAPASRPAPARSGAGMSAVCAAACVMRCAIEVSSSSDRVCCQSLSAIGSGSMLSLRHHAASSPERWSSRWWTRQTGMMNSSLTLRPSVRGCVKVRWCGSDGTRPQTRHAWRSTNLRWSVSRRRTVFPNERITSPRVCFLARLSAFRRVPVSDALDTMLWSGTA